MIYLMPAHSFAAHVASGAGATGAVVFALNGDQLSAWTAAGVAIVGALYGLYRSYARLAEDARRDRELLDEIQAANLAAIRAGRDVPYPRFLPRPGNPAMQDALAPGRPPGAQRRATDESGPRPPG